MPGRTLVEVAPSPFSLPTQQTAKFPQTNFPPAEAEKREVRRAAWVTQPSGGRTEASWRCQVLCCAHAAVCGNLTRGVWDPLVLHWRLPVSLQSAGLWAPRLGGRCPDHPEAWQNAQAAGRKLVAGPLSASALSCGHLSILRDSRSRGSVASWAQPGGSSVPVMLGSASLGAGLEWPGRVSKWSGTLQGAGCWLATAFPQGAGSGLCSCS